MARPHPRMGDVLGGRTAGWGCFALQGAFALGGPASLHGPGSLGGRGHLVLGWKRREPGVAPGEGGIGARPGGVTPRWQAGLPHRCGGGTAPVTVGAVRACAPRMLGSAGGSRWGASEQGAPWPHLRQVRGMQWGPGEGGRALIQVGEKKTRAQARTTGGRGRPQGAGTPAGRTHSTWQGRGQASAPVPASGTGATGKLSVRWGHSGAAGSGGLGTLGDAQVGGMLSEVCGSLLGPQSAWSIFCDPESLVNGREGGRSESREG